MPAEYRVLDWRRGGDAPNAAPRARLAGQLAGTRPRSIERALVYGRRGLDRAISLAENGLVRLRCSTFLGIFLNRPFRVT